MAQDKNIGRMMAQLGEIPPDSPLNLSDMDIVEEYGLDPKLAFTDDINEAALQASMKRQVKDYTGAGMDIKTAMSMAQKQMNDTRKQHDKIRARWKKEVGPE